MPLSEKERQQINTLVARFEAESGVEAVAAVIARADAYPEIPWKAYAMGSVVGALALALYPFLAAGSIFVNAAAFNAMVIVGAGALLMVLAVSVPAVARLFLDRIRAETETRQHAQALFLERELFRAPERRAVLVLVSRFERTVAIVPDTGLASYCSAGDLAAVVAAMAPLLRRGNVAPAFGAALDALQELLHARGIPTSEARANVLADEVVVEARR